MLNSWGKKLIDRDGKKTCRWSRRQHLVKSSMNPFFGCAVVYRTDVWNFSVGLFLLTGIAYICGLVCVVLKVFMYICKNLFMYYSCITLKPLPPLITHATI